MRVLIIGEAERAEVARVRRYAEAHPFSAAELRALLEASGASSCVVEEIPPAFVTVSRA